MTYNRNTWNHRIILKDGWYSIREVYYEDDTPTLVDEEPEGVLAESLEELKEVYEQMKEAFDAPVLKYENIG